MSGRATLVGIRLVTEVLDRYHGPDARKLWLIAWAEKANDGTRAGWPTREVLAHRTGRSPSRASHIAEELVAEGVLKRDGGGNRTGSRPPFNATSFFHAPSSRKLNCSMASASTSM